MKTKTKNPEKEENMRKVFIPLILISISVLILSGCGQNPWGPGASGGLNFFAKVGKAMQKPSAIEDEENGKEGAKSTISEGTAVAKRLAKGSVGVEDNPWLDSNWISVSGDTLAYYEMVTNKPCEEDSEKLATGTGEVKFGYSGTTPVTLDNLDPNQITDVYSWHFVGEENKTWKKSADGNYSEICSVDVTVTFSTTAISDFKPGKTWAWGKNISATEDLGKGDTASFLVDSLDEVNATQYGEGHFYDANTEDENSDESASFDFDLQILHKNSIDSLKPYERYEDNEGIMSFLFPWGTQDSLYFSIHFFPDYYREGEIRKNSADGPILVKFTHNEKTGDGTATYYDEDGNEIGNE